MWMCGKLLCLVKGYERIEERSETVVTVDWTKVRTEGEHEHEATDHAGIKVLTFSQIIFSRVNTD